MALAPASAAAAFLLALASGMSPPLAGLPARDAQVTPVRGLRASVPLPPRLSPALPAARGKLLVARRGLPDPRFARTVVLLLRHESAGAMGLIINRPSRVRLSQVIPAIPQLGTHPDPVFLGGPVEHERILLLLRAERRRPEARHIFADVYVSSSLDLLREIVSRAADPPRFRVFAGYAGWGSSQLDREIARGDWHVVDADVQTVFETSPAELWPTLIAASEGQVAFGADPAYDDPCGPERTQT